MPIQVEHAGKILNDPKRPMKERFRALFTLENINGKKLKINSSIKHKQVDF